MSNKWLDIKKEWNNGHLHFTLGIIEIDKGQSKHYKLRNRDLVTVEVSGMKSTKPVRFCYTYDTVEYILSALVSFDGKPKVERELGIKIQ